MFALSLREELRGSGVTVTALINRILPEPLKVARHARKAKPRR